MANRSLDDFLDADGATDGEDERAADESPGPDAPERGDGDGADERAADADADGPPVAPGAVEPAVSTYAYSGAGGVCEACGERVERRWRGGDGLVCPACKEW